MSVTPALPVTSSVELHPARLAHRLAAMTYEAVLLFGVVFVVAYALLSLARWTYPLAPLQRSILQAVLFAVGVFVMIAFIRGAQRVEPFFKRR